MSRPERFNTNVPKCSRTYKYMLEDEEAELLRLAKNRQEIEEKLKTEKNQEKIYFMVSQIKSIQFAEASTREALAKKKQ